MQTDWDILNKELKMNQEYTDIFKMYVAMAKQEMEHAQTLHNMSKKLAESKIGKENVDPMLMELWQEMEQTKVDKMALAKAYVTNAEL